MGKWLSAFAVITLLVGAMMGRPAYATGTADIHEIADPVRMVTNTLRSQDVAGNLGLCAIIALGFGLVVGHFAGGFAGLAVGIIGLAFVFGALTISQEFNWQAVGF